MTTPTAEREVEPSDRAGGIIACLHCGLPVPRGVDDRQFCCRGCRAVHAVLASEGLAERFYDLGGGRGHPVGGSVAGGTASPMPARRDWLIELLPAVDDGAQSLVSLEVDVQGIHCAACVWVLEELWRRRMSEGALDLRINPTLGRMTLTFEAAQFAVADYFDAVESLGYRIGPPGKVDHDGQRELLVRLGACTMFALNAMVFACAEYFGMSAADGSLFRLFQWLSCGLASLAVLVGGPVFFRSAWRAVGRRVLHLDLPIALGIALAYGGSLVAFLVGGQGDYFDSVTVFVALMLAGRFVQQRALRRNRDYLLASDGIDRMRVRRLRGAAGDGGATGGDTVSVDTVLVDEVMPGDRLLLAPGDLVPTHVRLVGSRSGAFSLDWIRGESEPRRFEVGEEVPAGAFLQGRRGVMVEATSTAAASGLSALLTRTQGSVDPSDSDPRSLGARFWRRLNRAYVVIVLVIAALAGLAWSAVDGYRAIDVVTSILVVTCPCALGIATPLAFELALARLRRVGIFVRRGSLLEKVRHIRRVVFDKTGTLTWGGARVEALHEIPRDVRNILSTMAQSSNHPVSRAIAAASELDGARFLEGLAVEEVPGGGTTAVDAEGRQYRLGSVKFALAADSSSVSTTDLPAGMPDSVVCLTRDGQVETLFAVDEDFRAGADRELELLRSLGIDVLLASGDRPAKVDRAAKRLGVSPADARAAMSPLDKADWIRRLGADSTMMVGDGLNDALAFEAAACAGTPSLDRPTMPGRADFFYSGNGTGAVREILIAGQAFHRTLCTNLWLAGLYNAVALSFCIAGAMQPWMVAVLMPTSSLLLIANTTRSMRVVGRVAEASS